nr:MAG TPA: hypothetical protein [Caudoviricetes sp.]
MFWVNSLTLIILYFTIHEVSIVFYRKNKKTFQNVKYLL